MSVYMYSLKRYIPWGVGFPSRPGTLFAALYGNLGLAVVVRFPKLVTVVNRGRKRVVVRSRKGVKGRSL